MATEIQPRTLEAENSDALINAQLKRTRSQVKGVEFGQRILKLIVGMLVFFLFASLLDHWVVAEGLPIWARVILWLSLIGGILWYAVKALLPLLLYRVNPLYAARTIEETKPSLKNSLINYLTLRSEQDRLPSVIYDAIAKQAATGVKDASVDHAVDHAPLIRWGYLLLGLTFCFALYFVVSPKNPFRTVARVVVPWADLTAPSRVQIVEVTPGSVQLYRGKTVKIAARIEGLAEEEMATLFYTTADGQQREQPIQLKLDDLRDYTTLLPAPAEKVTGVAAAPRELAGLQQDFEYYITAGDARSRTFRVQVAPAPYIGVERIEYKYPAYTKKPAEARQGEVNIEALEGTVVTIHGTANQPLKRAWIELRDSAGKPQKSSEMKITDMAASGSWTLALKDGSREQPDFPSYALRFRNQQNDENPEPIAYPVKVIRDEPPTIDFLAPSSAEISVPWDQPIAFEVRAQDPDFGLIEIQLQGMRGDKIVFNPNIASFAPANAHQGSLQKKYIRSPKDLSLQVGDVIEYSATATDNKYPNPNIVRTNPRRFRVIEAQKNRNQNNDALADKQQPNNPNQPQDKNQQRDPNQKGQPGDQQPPNNDPNQQPMGNQGPPNQGNPNNDPNNGQGNPQPQNDPTNLNNQDPNNQQGSGESRPQPNPANGQQNNPPQDPNQKTPQQNNSKQQPKNSDESGAKGSQQNKSNQAKPNNDSTQDNKSGEQSNKGQQPNESSKQNGDQKNNPMNGAGQGESQKGNQGNDPQPNNKPGDNSQQNPQSGEQNGKPEQNGKAEQNQQAGRPQEQNKKVNADGSQDADAMQRFKEHFEKNQKPPQEQANNSQQNKPNEGNQKTQDNNQPSGKQEPGKKEAGKQNEPGQQQSGKQEPGNKQESGKQESGKQQPGKEGGKQEGQASPSKEPSAQQNGNNKSGEAGKQESGKEPPSNDAKQPNGHPGEQKQTDSNQADSKQLGKQSPNGGAGQKPEPMTAQKQPGQGETGNEKQAGKTGTGEKQEAGAKAEQGAKPDQNGKQPGDMGQEGNRPNPEKNQAGSNPKEPNSQGSKSGNTTEPENKQNPMNNQQQEGMGNPNGSPEAQEKGKPNANPSNSNADGKNNKEQSPSNKGNDSASKGEEGGDKNGGGKQGGGQQENKAGRGSSGSNTEDEKGANAGKQKGDGETGTKAGRQQKSADKTGKSGNEKGNGTEQKPGDGKQPGGEAGKNTPEGKANEPGKQPGEPGGQPSAQTGPPREQKQQKNGPAGNMPGGGGNSNAPALPPEYNGPWQDTPEDKVNEAYTKKATDLVLEQMKNQLRSGNVDQDLLNKLGWSKDDAQRFVDRWETLKREAQQAGPTGDAAAAKLQERLRSLGLRPQQSSNSGDNVADDTQRGNRVNRRSAPPSEYRDIYRAFQKGASGG